jgi:hypothetical protein
VLPAFWYIGLTCSKDNTSDDLIGYSDENLPSTLDNWEDMHQTAFRKGNSHMFMKLGTWILLRFRQLAKIPLEEDPDGLLIPDHPANYQMDFDADFHEALGMTRLYSALAHIDTHPEYIAHIFHEIGKASSEERLGSSHPGFRPLPELPVPVKRYAASWTYRTTNPVCSMVSVKHWPYSSIEDSDAEGHRDDEEDVSGALSDMIISGAPVSAPAVPADEHDPFKRKRTISNTLSPPKVLLNFSPAHDHLTIGTIRQTEEGGYQSGQRTLQETFLFAIHHRPPHPLKV